MAAVTRLSLLDIIGYCIATSISYHQSAATMSAATAAASAMNTDAAANSMGKYFTSKIGELKEVSISISISSLVIV